MNFLQGRVSVLFTLLFEPPASNQAELMARIEERINKQTRVVETKISGEPVEQA